MGKDTLKIKSDYLSKIEMPWVKGGPLQSYDLKLTDLEDYLKSGNTHLKKIKVGRKDDRIIVKYRGKKINLMPIGEFVELPR